MQMPWGKHRGKDIEVLPSSYLGWLLEQARPDMARAARAELARRVEASRRTDGEQMAALMARALEVFGRYAGSDPAADDWLDAAQAFALRAPPPRGALRGRVPLTYYRGVGFRSLLEARYAALFDLAGWGWEYHPPGAFGGWWPTFRVEFPCGHSECPDTHVLLAEVAAHRTLEGFEGHPCLGYPCGGWHDAEAEGIPADAGAAFGDHPSVSRWEMSHGAGGGVYSIADWVDGDLGAGWRRADELVRGTRPEVTHGP